MKKLLCAVVACLALVGVFALAGCGSSNLEIGSANGDSFKVELTNGTEVAQKSISTRPTAELGKEGAFAVPLKQSDPLEPGQTADLYIDPATTENGVVDMQVTDADEKVLELHGVDVSDMKTATLKVSDGIAYLEYVSEATGLEINTLATEQEYKEAAEKAKKEAEKKAAEEKAKKEAEEKAKKEAEEQAQREAEEAAAAEDYDEDYDSGYDEDYTDDYSDDYSDDGGSDYSESGGGDSSSGSGDTGGGDTGENCVDDVVLN